MDLLSLYINLKYKTTIFVVNYIPIELDSFLNIGILTFEII